MAERVKVLYVAGWIYTGSTVLGNVLGEVDGVHSAGELRFFWSFARDGTKPCGCGAPLRLCPVWQPVLEATAGLDATRLSSLMARITLHRRLPQLLIAQRGGPGADDLAELRAAIAQLYGAIAATTGSRVVVDTSKSPLYAAILDGIPTIDLRIVHLVRDPRGLLMSRLRRDHGEDPLTVLLIWDFAHLVTELGWSGSGRYLRLRYEDAIRRPVDAVESILALAGEAARPPESLRAGRVELRPNHNVSGNSNRFRSGQIELRPDEAWRERLPGRPLAAATALTWPLLLRYGYPLVPAR
jgi:hypothetical protein